MNYCELTDINSWIEVIAKQCPSLRQLSMIGNPGAKSEISGATNFENEAYRYQVIQSLPLLEYLDGHSITSDHRRRGQQDVGRHYTVQNGHGFFRMLNPTKMFNAFRKENKQLDADAFSVEE